MNIAEAMRVVAQEFAFPRTGDDTEPNESRIGSPASTVPEPEDGPRPTVILPFFSVLVRGRDGAWSDGENGAPAHPSVAYARVIYFAIFLNWIIDFVGLAYLFYTFLAWSDSFLLHGAIPLGLAATLSTGLAAFATSLVQKPLPRPTWPRWSRRACLVAILYIVSCVVVLVSPDLFVGTSLWTLAWIGLSFAPVFAMAVAFGVMDALYVTIRAVMMIGVGYLVAAPLHEAMFQKEIEEEYYESRESDLKSKLLKLETARVMNDATENEACIDREMRDKVQTTENDCADEQSGFDRAVALLSTAETVKARATTLRGVARKKARKTRDELWEDASARGLDDPETQQIISAILLLPKDQKIEIQENIETMTKRRDDALKALDDCVEAAAATARERASLSVPCREARDSDFAYREQELLDELEEYTSRTNKPGAIDRGLALNNLIHDAAQKGDARAEDAKAIVDHLLDTAWILAFLMPLVVLTMKVTAGARLEPYLERRWELADKKRQDDAIQR